jgi:catechol 2,3-dioxygenase-like lactoylglutathione lyase family enzyme
MIKGVHAMLYSTDAEKTRAFFRDVMGLPNFDSGDGWLIFTPPEADIGVHPGDRTGHSISFYCDDINATVEQLKAKGANFTKPVWEEEWGYVATLEVPGAGEVDIYQPKYGG